MRVVPNSPLPVEHANRFGQQLADKVEHFLTTYFAISRERLSLEVSLTDVDGRGTRRASAGTSTLAVGSIPAGVEAASLTLALSLREREVCRRAELTVPEQSHQAPAEVLRRL